MKEMSRIRISIVEYSEEAEKVLNIVRNTLKEKGIFLDTSAIDAIPNLAENGIYLKK